MTMHFEDQLQQHGWVLLCFKEYTLTADAIHNHFEVPHASCV